MLVSLLAPRGAEQVLATLGQMQWSKSSLDRVPKALSARWEAQRQAFEASGEVPHAARAVVVSLDGAMRGGYREAGCAMVAMVDSKGALMTIVAAEVEAVLGQRPDCTVINLAEGAKDNWMFLACALPERVEVFGFYHAAEQLKGAFDAAYGTDSPTAAAPVKQYRHRPRHGPDGANRVIRALVYLHSKSPGNERLVQVPGYFRGNRHRRGYADAKARGLPIGSGVVEAACKTLVGEQPKRSGKRWGVRGGQAILTLCSLVQSRRFDHAWSLFARPYRTQVSCPDNVVPFRHANIHWSRISIGPTRFNGPMACPLALVSSEATAE